MGIMRFQVSGDAPPAEYLENFAYLAGFDRIPWKAEVRLRSEILEIQRPRGPSASLTTPWPIGNNGLIALSTGTLVERSKPYHLWTELLRGKLGQLLNQYGEWQTRGLEVPAGVEQSIVRAIDLLGDSIFSQRKNGEKHFKECLAIIREATQAVCDQYVAQALTMRRLLSRSKIAFWLGPTLQQIQPTGQAADVLASFATAASIRFTWADGEPSPREYCFDLADSQLFWCRQAGILRGVGPLICLSPDHLPGWLSPDVPFSEVETAALNFLAQTIRRYRAKVDFWEVLGPLNPTMLFDISEEKMASFAARAIQTVHNLDPGVTVAISVRQPWLEDLRFHDCKYPAPIVVDALLRGGINLDGIVLEIQLGYVPQGTFLRDRLDLIRQIEYWAQWGIPIFIRFCAPSRLDADPLCTTPFQPFSWQWDETEQTRWTQEYLMMLLGCPYVRGVFWSPWCDFEPHEFPHGGLFDFTQRPKEVTHFLNDVRHEWLATPLR
ncbi:MAG: hypothetical protein ACUVQG_12015 [Thermogutta sp.]